jgi:hypothetical protein
MNAQNYTLFRNANVKVSNVFNKKGDIQAHILVNGKHEHIFDASSRVSKALSHASGEQLKLATAQLEDRLTEGSYFFVDDQLVDFRDSIYTGFVHNDRSIEQLVRHIGIAKNETLTRSGLRLNTVPSDFMLMNRHSTEGFDVPGYLAGGAFSSSILFTWSPFTSFVRGAFEIVRQICSNGMVGTSELINSRIPLINRWEEHLQIANLQMQNKVSGLVQNRLGEMGHERASVADLQLIAKHAGIRKLETKNASERSRLDSIIAVSDPVNHLADYYHGNVFQDKSIAARVGGHLTQFDCYNLATELSTHTGETEESTTGALQRLANGLLFPAANSGGIREINRTPLLSAFSNPDQAFFGA